MTNAVAGPRPEGDIIVADGGVPPLHWSRSVVTPDTTSKKWAVVLIRVLRPRRRGGGGAGAANDPRNTTPATRPPQHNQRDPQYANDGAPRTRKRHPHEHRPQRPTERSDPAQHAKGRPGDCPGPRKETTTRRNVTRGGGGGTHASRLSLCGACAQSRAAHCPHTTTATAPARASARRPPPPHRSGHEMTVDGLRESGRHPKRRGTATDPDPRFCRRKTLKDGAQPSGPRGPTRNLWTRVPPPGAPRPPTRRPTRVPPRHPPGPPARRLRRCAPGKLNSRTICMASRHYPNRVHYDLHSMYGWSQHRATHAALSQSRRAYRSLVMSSSTFPGSGQYGGHCLRGMPRRRGRGDASGPEGAPLGGRPCGARGDRDGCPVTDRPCPPPPSRGRRGHWGGGRWGGHWGGGIRGGILGGRWGGRWGGIGGAFGGALGGHWGVIGGRHLGGGIGGGHWVVIGGGGIGGSLGGHWGGIGGVIGGSLGGHWGGGGAWGVIGGWMCCRRRRAMDCSQRIRPTASQGQVSGGAFAHSLCTTGSAATAASSAFGALGRRSVLEAPPL